MTFTQFCEHMREMKKAGWRKVNEYGIRLTNPTLSLTLNQVIRGDSAFPSLCPLSALYYHLTGKEIDNGEFELADCDLGLDKKLRYAIIDAADSEKHPRKAIRKIQTSLLEIFKD